MRRWPQVPRRFCLACGAGAAAVAALLAPGSAEAFEVYNRIGHDIEVYVDVPNVPNDRDFRATISPHSSAPCPFDVSDCGGSRGTDLEVIITVPLESDFQCRLTMPAGGFAVISAQDRKITPEFTARHGVMEDYPGNIYCTSHIQEAHSTSPIDYNGDGRIDEGEILVDYTDPFVITYGPNEEMTPENRDVRFLVTGDPQYSREYIAKDWTENLAEVFSTFFWNLFDIDPNIDSEEVYEANFSLNNNADKTMITIMDQLAESMQVRGVIVSGDLTARFERGDAV